MPSTAIRRFAYDHMSGDLWVEFVNGHRLVYSGVPREVADALGCAFAKGAYFDSRIRGNYPCREVVHAGDATES